MKGGQAQGPLVKNSHSIAVRGHPGESWLVEAEKAD